MKYAIEFTYQDNNYSAQFCKINEGENSTNQFEVFQIEPPIINVPKSFFLIIDKTKSFAEYPSDVNRELFNSIWNEVEKTCKIYNISIYRN